MSRWLIWLLWPAIAGAQQSVVAAPDASVSAALANLSQRAATVFVGQVVDIRRNAGVVEIQFRVDTPLVGQSGRELHAARVGGDVAAGSMALQGRRAGAGVSAWDERAGLSSAVDGGEGVVPVMADTDGTVLLDVRRLSTRVLRQVGQPLDDGNGAMALKDVLPVIESRGTKPVRPVRRPLPPAAVQLTPPSTGGTGRSDGYRTPIVEMRADVQ